MRCFLSIQMPLDSCSRSTRKKATCAFSFSSILPHMMSRIWAVTRQLICFSCRIKHLWFPHAIGIFFVTISRAMTGIRTIGLVCHCNLHGYLLFRFSFLSDLSIYGGNVSTNIRLLSFLWLHKFSIISCSWTTFADRMTRLHIHCCWPTGERPEHSANQLHL
jgi:hypothetical protein